MSETYRWRGVNPRGVQQFGQVTCPDGLAAFVEGRYRQGWRSLTVCSGPGPVPPPALGPADVVAEIGPHPDHGRRVWWAEKRGGRKVHAGYREGLEFAPRFGADPSQEG